MKLKNAAIAVSSSAFRSHRCVHMTLHTLSSEFPSLSHLPSLPHPSLSSQAVPYSRDYKRKCESFRVNLPKPPEAPKQFEIPVRRGRLFEDSHRGIMGVRNKEMMRCRLWVKFDKEKGLDYGGVAREWFFLLSHEMFNPYFGLFEYSSRCVGTGEKGRGG